MITDYRSLISLKFVIFAIISLVLISCNRKPSTHETLAFEEQMASALGLKLVSKDSGYLYSRLEIYNDTIAGFYMTTNRSNYFVQSLKDPKNKIEFNNDQLRHPSISHIDQFRNGCMYFGNYGGSTMQSLCSDGTLTEYFKKYQDTLFYVTKVMLYKNYAVLTSMNGVYVFDIGSQQLIFKHRFRDDSPMQGLSSIVDNILVFTESIHESKKAYSLVVGFDLDKLEVKWTSRIEDDADYLYDQQYLPHFHIYRDGNNVIIPEVNACYRVDLQTGKIVNRVPWKGFFEFLAHNPRFNVEDGKLYVNNYNDSTNLLCIDMKTNKKLWNLKNTYYWGLYREYVIAATADLKYYLIIDKRNGRILHKISKPKSNVMDIDFLDKYILINRTAIYR